MNSQGEIVVAISDNSKRDAAHSFSSCYGVDLINDIDEIISGTYLHFCETGVELCVKNKKQVQKIHVDFSQGSRAHRRKFGGGKGQAIAKAVGMNKGVVPSVLDATAGLGGDAFVLASLGCSLTLLERSPIAHLLLADGLARGRRYAREEDAELFEILSRMALQEGDSLALLKSVPEHDVVYLDPMFPTRKKSAEVKKEMKAFHSVVGEDLDSDGLLDLAKQKARYRVVVKRPRIAPHLNNEEPSFKLEGKSSRYDIYALKAFP